MAKSTVKGTKIKLDRSDIIIRTIGYVVVTFYALACVLPFLIIIGTSFTSEEVIRSEGAQLFPKQFTTKAYEMVIQGGAIWTDYHDDLNWYTRWSGNHFHDWICFAEKGFPIPQCNLILHLFYHTVLSRFGSVLPVNDTDLQAAG